MTDLVTTGPAMQQLRWGQQRLDRDDGRHERRFMPQGHHHANPGYLHPGVLAAAVLDAARVNEGLPRTVASVSVAMQRLVPLGGELRMVTRRTGDTVQTEVLHHGDAGSEADPIHHVAVGEVRGGAPPLPAQLGELRSLATVPVPEPTSHEPHESCFVCGADNPQGLQILPGWHAPDTVVSAFVANEGMARDGHLDPAMTAAVLSCPTLWACKEDLDANPADGAVLTDYEVRFLRDAPVPRTVRTVGLRGACEDDILRGLSALVDEQGIAHAAASGTWHLVGETPAREPGRPTPLPEQRPLTGGRPEEHFAAGGRSLPDRREAPGARSERVGDDDRRDAIGVRDGITDGVRADEPPPAG